MKRSGPLSRSAYLESGGKLRRRKPLNRYARTSAQNRKRRAAEWERAYGSKARVEFVKALPCCVCGSRYGVQNAHVGSHVEAGMGRRGDADTVAPLCLDCHAAQEGRTAAFEAARGLPAGFLARAAAETEASWQRHLASGGGR